MRWDGSCGVEWDLLGLHLVVLLLEVVDLAADHLNLLDMAGDCGDVLAGVGYVFRR